MNDNWIIYIPEQFDRPSDIGYLRRHIELTRKLESLFEPEAGNPSADLPDARKDELFHQACEDVARSILLSEDAITSIPVSEAQAMVEKRYNEYMENPQLAGASRASAIH